MIVDCGVYERGVRIDVNSYDVGVWRSREDPDVFMWLGLHSPSEQEVADACRSFRFDSIEPARVLQPHERPVLALDNDIVHLVLRTARYNRAAEEVVIGEITVLVNDWGVLTVRHGNASPLSQVRTELERQPARLANGPYATLTAILARVIGDYPPALDGFESAVIDVEREVFSPSRAQPVHRMYQLKREVRTLLVGIESLDDHGCLGGMSLSTVQTGELAVAQPASPRTMGSVILPMDFMSSVVAGLAR